MKKLFVILAVAGIFTTSCGTLFAPATTQCQKTQPAPGQPQRAIRPVVFVADLLIFWPSLIVDFSNGSIYEPCGNGATVSK